MSLYNDVADWLFPVEGNTASDGDPGSTLLDQLGVDWLSTTPGELAVDSSLGSNVSGLNPPLTIPWGTIAIIVGCIFVGGIVLIKEL